MQQLRVKHDFTAEGPGEMSVRAGEVVVRMGEERNGWTKVKRGDAVGFVPSTYVAPEVVVPTRTAPTPTPTAVAQAHVVQQPRPSAPPIPAAAASATTTATTTTTNVAVEHAECPICFDLMSAKPAAVLLAGGGAAKKKRACRHFIHLECADDLVRRRMMSCPVCRAPFAACAKLPSWETEPKAFFDAIDADGNGALNRAEVMEMMQALLPVDFRALERDADAFWRKWDKNGDGMISFGELMSPDGLLAYVKHRFAKGERPPPPVLTRRTRQEWFDYFDEDGSKAIEQEELVRALVKTFGLSSDLRKLNELRENVRNVWMIFDHDGSNSVDYGEFVAPDGLADTLIASLHFTQSGRLL